MRLWPHWALVRLPISSFRPGCQRPLQGSVRRLCTDRATVLSEEIARVLRSPDGEFEHGFTSSGHPVSCAVALKTIELLKRHRIIETVERDSGPHLRTCLHELEQRPLVAEVRSAGLMAAIELRSLDQRRNLGSRCRDICAELGLIVRAEGDTLMLAPPLICTRADLSEIVGIVWSSARAPLKSVSRARHLGTRLAGGLASLFNASRL
ncbi:MAG: aminotransferase class III-fold pyridoxal phosphate-dependent enzyme [Steroidobacteraceae bacterium]